MVLLTQGRQDDRATLLVFANRSRTPRLAVKVGWSESAIGALRTEGETLRDIGSYFPKLTVTVPRFLGMLDSNNGEALVMLAVDGRRCVLPRARYRSTPTVGRYLSRLVELHESTSVGAVSCETRSLSDLSWLAHWAAVSSRANRARAATFHQLADDIASCSMRYRPCWQHGDLASGNVLCGKKGQPLGVIDWELANARQDPWFDLSYIACATAFELGGTTAPMVGWVVKEVVKPRWSYGFPLQHGMALTALRAAHRAECHVRGSKERWLDVAAGMLPGTQGAR